MEGLLRSLVHSADIAVENPTDYEARSNIMWIATWALNTFVAKGKTTDREVHMLGQAVGAHTDATHGMTLAAVSLPYYRYNPILTITVLVSKGLIDSSFADSWFSHIAVECGGVNTSNEWLELVSDEQYNLLK